MKVEREETSDGRLLFLIFTSEEATQLEFKLAVEDWLAKNRIEWTEELDFGKNTVVLDMIQLP